MLLPPLKPRKGRGSLRFLAGTCIFSGWLTLVVSLILAVVSVTAGFAAQRTNLAATTGTQYFPQAPPASAGPGQSGLEGGGGLSDLGIPGIGGDSGLLGGLQKPGLNFNPLSMFQSLLAPLYFISAAFTLVTGIVTCLLFLGLGQACYVLLDLEEQTFQLGQALHLVAARFGVR